jgi:uncharacterized membrane protein
LKWQQLRPRANCLRQKAHQMKGKVFFSLPLQLFGEAQFAVRVVASLLFVNRLMTVIMRFARATTKAKVKRQTEKKSQKSHYLV